MAGITHSFTSPKADGPDTTLVRPSDWNAAHSVSDIALTGAAAGTDMATFKVTGDTQQRLIVDADGTLLWGSGALAGDTNLYRSAANVLKTDDKFVVANAYIHIDDVAATLYLGADVNLCRAAANVLGTPDSLAIDGILTIGGDTDLYRSAADVLKTDDSLTAAGNLVVSGSGTAGSSITSAGATLGISGDSGSTLYYNGLGFWVGGASAGLTADLAITAGKVFTWGGDTNLYRSAANVLKTDDLLEATAGLRAGAATAAVRIGQLLDVQAVSNYGGAALTAWSATAGEAPVIDLQRSKSATPGTMTVVAADDVLGHVIFRGADGTSFQQAAGIVASVDGTPGAADMPGRLGFYTTPDGSATWAERLRIDNAGKVWFGPGAGLDTNLYRVDANDLMTDDSFRAGVNLQVARVDDAGKLYFGTAADTNLYRSAADTLKTDDTFNIGNAGGLQVSGTKVVGAQGAAVADATDAATAITQLNALLARCRTHGLIAT